MQLARGQRIALVTSDQPGPRALLAIQDLISYLQRSLDCVVRWHKRAADLKSIEEPVCLLFGEPASNIPLRAAAQRLNLSLSESTLGAEGCRIHATALEGKTAILLAGATGAGACHAAYSFLERDLGIGFFLDGNRIPNHDSIDLSGVDRTEKPSVPIRGLFFHPTWKHPHQNCWRLWSWPRWRNALDWMRRKRFNTLPLFHDEGGYLWGDVIFRAFPELKVTDQSLSQFVVDPSWRTELNHKIFAHARESGLAIAYNLFYSQVPEFYADAHPDLKYHNLAMRNVGICASQPECHGAMRKLWGKILETHGVDDSHLYLVCSYQHERALCSHFEDRNATTMKSFELLRELDPRAEMYIETWCWKYRHEEPPRPREVLFNNTKREWGIFDKGVPKEIGVVEWDVKRSHHDSLPIGFNGRPYIQLTHTNMEGWNPPTMTHCHPKWLCDYFGEAIVKGGARGVLYFHIQAGTNDMAADLGAEIGWDYMPDADAFIRDYARRRFGAGVGEALAESLRLFCDATDSGKVNGSLAFPGFDRSGEYALSNTKKEGEQRMAWIRERLDIFQSQQTLAAKAMAQARSVAARMVADPFFDLYNWELEYVAARYVGLVAFYESHLVSGADPAKADALFARALDAFHTAKELFRDKKGHWMSGIRTLEPDVPYTAAFLKDWETRGFWEPIVHSFHVVWERMDFFEERLRSFRPRKAAL